MNGKHNNIKQIIYIQNYLTEQSNRTKINKPFPSKTNHDSAYNEQYKMKYT